MRDASLAAIERAMKQQGVNRAELARRTGMGRSEVSHIFNASDNRTTGGIIKTSTIDRMLAALGYEAATVTLRKLP